MAKPYRLLLIIPLIATIFLASSFEESQAYSKTVSPSSLGLINKQEKLTHLHFYFHDIISGDNPSAVKVAKAAGTSATAFGTVVIADDALTEGPDMSSKLVGRAQGMYASTGKQELSLLMNMNFVFTEGEFNGSSVSLFGRNPALSSAVREMPIVGGSGAFRFARGYAQAKTYTFDRSGNAVVEYDMYIWHY